MSVGEVQATAFATHLETGDGEVVELFLRGVRIVLEFNGLDRQPHAQSEDGSRDKELRNKEQICDSRSVGS